MEDGSFDDAPLEPLELEDLEPQLLRPIERVTQEVIAACLQKQRLERTLAPAHDGLRAAHVFQQNQPTTAPKYAPRLGKSSAGVGDRAQGEGGDNGVECLARE